MLRLLQGGMVWQKDSFERLDILLDADCVRKVALDIDEPFATVTDCSGSYLSPGIVDMHVHVGERICGCDLADDYRSLSALADSCGLSAIGAFITEHRTADPLVKHLERQYQFYQMKSRAECSLPIRWHLTPTVSEPEDILELFDAGCDLKFYTTYKPNGIYRSYSEIARWMQDLADLQPRMLIHCEDDAIVTDYCHRNPFKTAFDLTLRRPEAAEIKAVERVLDLAVQYAYPVHIVHVSSPQAALLIKQAKQHAPVTCETAPHYLLLNEDYLKRNDGHRWICTPPLRVESSRGLLLEFLQDGVFDALATDHCPFITADKDHYQDNPEQVPSGIAGLGATLPVLYEALVRTGKLRLETLFALLNTQPGEIMNLPALQVEIKPESCTRIFMLKPDNRTWRQITASLADTPNPWMDYQTKLEIKRVK